MRCLASFVAALIVFAFAAAGGVSYGQAKKDDPHHIGPHKGHLIELGEEEYHGELVEDEKAGTITIYILDGTAKKAVPLEAKTVTINIKRGKEADQFKLAASPDKGDPEDKSSRFVSKDKHLAEALEAKDAQSQLVVTIKGKQYRGKIEHHHDEKK